MPDDLPSPIGPDIEKILLRLYPIAVQDLVETSESLMHKEITNAQINARAVIQARLGEEADQLHHADGYSWAKAIVLAQQQLHPWFQQIKEEMQQIIAWHQEQHRKRVRNLLAWWEDQHENAG